MLQIKNTSLELMKSVKILHIGDMQNGFTRENGHLYVQGAQDIITPTNLFLRQVREGVFDYTLIILDTHFTEEYHQSEEGKLFPIHCEYDTTDWELSIDVSGLPNIQYLTKNKFDMWGEIERTNISFTSPQRQNAYGLLFHIIDDPHDPTRIVSRDDFITAMNIDRKAATIEVTMIGVASDYCIRHAMEGWLARGASVTIIHDLTKGIEKETPKILNEFQYRQYKKGRLRSVTSTEYIHELLFLEKTGPNNFLSHDIP